METQALPGEALEIGLTFRFANNCLTILIDHIRGAIPQIGDEVLIGRKFTVAARMRTESLVAPSQAPGKRFLDARDRRPGTASEAALLPSREVSRPDVPAKPAGYSSTLACAPQNRGYSSNHGKSRLVLDCVVGLAGLEPATRPL
jgi:hypothetical protein